MNVRGLSCIVCYISIEKLAALDEASTEAVALPFVAVLHGSTTLFVSVATISYKRHGRRVCSESSILHYSK